jgi:O-antigen ligase
VDQTVSRIGGLCSIGGPCRNASGMILGFLLTALYWPGLAGAATIPKWGLLAVALPLVILKSRNEYNRFTLVHLFGALFILWSAISLIWTPNRLDGLGELIKLVILAQAFVYGSRLDSLRPILIGMACGLILSSAMVLIQLVYPDVVLHSTIHSGLFINSGALGEIAALVFIGVAYGIGNIRDGLRKWNCILLVCLAPSILLPQSRGSWLALIAAFTFWLWSKSKISALVLVALTAISFTYSLHIGFHVASVEQRLGLYQDAIHGLTWLGHGIGSFWTDYAPLSNTVDIFLERPEHLHNDWLEVIFEQGAIGALAIGLLWAWRGIACYRGRPTVGDYICLGFVSEAIVGFPLHNPCTAFLAALCLGHLARDGASIRDLLYRGGIL